MPPPGGPKRNSWLSRALRIEVTAEATQGAVQNVILLEKRQTMLAFVTTGPALQGWNGTDWAKGMRYRSMRVMFPMYDTTFQFVVHRRLAAKSLDDFKGLRIGGGPRGGTSGTYVEQVFKILGIPAAVQHGAWDNLGSQLAERELDGAAAAIGAPFPILAQLDAQQIVDFVAPSPEQIASIRKQMPEITPSAIAAGTYRSLTKDYPTIGLYNFAVAHKDLADGLVYQIVKTVFENQAELVKAHPVAKETIPENIERNTLSHSIRGRCATTEKRELRSPLLRSKRPIEASRSIEKADTMPAGSTDALAMEATIAARGRIADRRRAVTSAIGLLGLVAAILTSALTWSGVAWAQGGDWPRSITIGTASPGGVYDAYGEGLARILTRALRIEVTAQVTQGAAQNIVLMEKKEALLGFATMGVALQGWNELGEGNPVSRHARHIPDVRHGISLRGAEAVCDQIARRFCRTANWRRSPGRHRWQLCP